MDDKFLRVLASAFYKYAFEDIEPELDESEFQDVTFEQFKIKSALDYLKNSELSDVYYTLWDEEGQELHFDEEDEQVANEYRQEVLQEIYKDKDFKASFRASLEEAINAGMIQVHPDDLPDDEYNNSNEINWLGDDPEDFEEYWTKKKREKELDGMDDPDSDMDDPNFGKPESIEDDSTDLDDL